MDRGQAKNPHQSPEWELDFVLRMDRLRDEAKDPEDLLGTINQLMGAVFEADVCLLFVMDPVSGEQELRSLLDHTGTVGRLSARDLEVIAEGSLRVGQIEIRRDSEETAGFAAFFPIGSLAVVPIIVGGSERVGTLLLTRAHEPLSELDLTRLHFAETQLDSALVQAQRLHELELKSKELEAIYRVDKIRDTHQAFPRMLDQVLRELRRVIPCDLAFIMLYDRAGHRLELRASSPEDMADHWLGTGEIESTAGEAVQTGELTVRRVDSTLIGSIMCVPLILREETLGVFGMTRSGSGRFKDGEQRLLKAIASQMDTAIFESLEKGRLREVLGRTVDPQVLERLLNHPAEGILEGERQILTVLYADLRGSTRLASKADPKDFVSFINHYLSATADVVIRHGGTLDKFMGDEVMALFGAPLPMDDHALRAVRAGLEIQEVHGATMERWAATGFEVPPLGVGIATGEVIVGEMGSGRRCDYTALGTPVNLGARIRTVSEGGQVLISEETYAMVRDQIQARSLNPFRFKGIDGDVKVWEVTG